MQRSGERSHSPVKTAYHFNKPYTTTKPYKSENPENPENPECRNNKGNDG